MKEHGASIPGIGVRPATAADLPRLVPVINAAYAIETFLEGARTDSEKLAAQLSKGTILVAEDGSGCLLGTIYAEKRGRRGYLGQFAIDPAHPCAGLARRLVQAAEEHLRAQGCRAVDITVLSLRPELPPIYRRYGYQEVCVEPHGTDQPVKNGAECHGIVMTKKL